MQGCWRQAPGDRPMFSELHATFDRFLKQQTQDQLPYMVVLSNPCPLEQNPSEIEETTINLDVEMIDTAPNGSKRESHLIHSVSLNNLNGMNPASEDQHSFIQMFPHTSQDLLLTSSTQDITIENPFQGKERNIEEDGQKVVHIRYVELPTRVSQKSTLPQQ